MGTRLRDFVNVCASRRAAWMEWRIEEAIRRNAKKLMVKHHVPGLQVAFCVRGRATREIVIGEARRGETLTPQHRFRICSLSKPVSAVVALTLVRDGVVSLDENIAEEFTEVLPDLAKSGARITLRDLLCHMSGFDTMHSPRAPEEERHWTLRDVLDERLGEPWKVRRIGEPGTVQCYSGINFWLLQLVLELRSGKPMRELGRERVFEPLGMTHAEYEIGEVVPQGIVAVHDDAGNELPAKWAPGGAASGVVCGARELLEIAKVTFDGSSLLPEELRRGLCESCAGSRAWTLGWHTYKGVDARSLGHGGVEVGTRGIAAVVPAAQCGIVALTNSSGGFYVTKSLTGLLRELALRSIDEPVDVRETAAETQI